nr:collagen alpha-1(I) chain-like [Macaca nemestrina]
MSFQAGPLSRARDSGERGVSGVPAPADSVPADGPGPTRVPGPGCCCPPPGTAPSSRAACPAQHTGQRSRHAAVSGAGGQREELEEGASRRDGVPGSGSAAPPPAGTSGWPGRGSLRGPRCCACSAGSAGTQPERDARSALAAPRVARPRAAAVSAQHSLARLEGDGSRPFWAPTQVRLAVES